MKTKKTTKSKSRAKAKPRTKLAKILFLKRSAAGKSRWRKGQVRKVATKHLLIAALLVAGIFATGNMVFSMSGGMVAPEGDEQIDMNRYIDAAEERRAQLAAEEAKRAQERAAAEAVKKAVSPPAPPPIQSGPDQSGIASWYALGLREPDAFTCASTRFPRGTYLEVTNLRNFKKVVCLVNDYGPQPYTRRVIDLSRGSFQAIENLGRGTMPVEVRVVKP